MKLKEHVYEGLILWFLVVIIISSGCKKDPYYPVADELKPYFLYQTGSYWIYQNDVTGTIDSVRAIVTYGAIDDFDHTRDPVQILTVNLKSEFLASIQLMGQHCGKPNAMFVSTWLTDDTNSNMSPSFYPVYFPYWLPSQTNMTAPCVFESVVNFMVIPSDTINNVRFDHIFYSYIRSKDSSATNTHFSSREIWIAKNVGIIKIKEKFRYFNIERSYSLIRYQVIQ